jgi:rhomboid-like protein
MSAPRHTIFSHARSHKLLTSNTHIITGHELVGRGFFLSTYIAAGTCGSLASLAYFVLTRNFKSASIGASGAVNGMFALLCVATSRDHVRVPFTEWDMALNPKLALVAYLALEVYNFRMRRFKTMDHMAHLAGAAVGIGAGTAWRWKDLVAWWEAWMGNGEEGSDGGGDVMKKVEGDQEELGAGRKEGEA